MWKRTSNVVILAAWIITVSACAPVRILPYPPLPLPTQEKLPNITAEEFTVIDGRYWINQQTMINIFTRDKMREVYETRLENVIKSTH